MSRPRTVLDVEGRAAAGKAARQAVPLSAHAGWAPPAGRCDPVDILQEQARDRVPELVPIRYGRMLLSPFTFYRGAAAVMAADLAPSPVSGLVAQLCGDAHLSNFGAFASPERRLVFDLNDFDETHPGPWEWDVKRLAASLEIAGRDRGFAPADRRDIVLAALGEYRTRMRQAAGMGNLDVWYAHVALEDLLERLRADADGVLSRKTLKKTGRDLAKIRTRDNLQAFTKLTEEVDGHRRIRSDPPLVVPLEDLLPPGAARSGVEHVLVDLLRSYRRSLQTDRRHLLEQFRLVHVARKVVGVGSVGTRAWILLLLGRDDQDPLLLQAKQATTSVLETFAGASRYRNHGQRVVAGQRLLQATSDIFLGWDRIRTADGGHQDYYVRQLRDWKGSADTDRMLVPGLTLYARLCGGTLARAHARSGDRVGIAAYLGKKAGFDVAVAGFATAYADQNERDHQALVEAVARGRVPAETGV
ncbi:DUF2252 domain-containing protein [Kineosporia sp. A_224]|uniref:DUF2252 domain-containing protein n=1 Tax=Kineosporia sp. A_224 TaxID=1962180 RepID=UPI000B4C0AE8|nr:DUF2252 domain-containing protein [Kineosporia sp. A_224]